MHRSGTRVLVTFASVLTVVVGLLHCTTRARRATRKRSSDEGERRRSRARSNALSAPHRAPEFFSVHADAMVSPANSFGIMDGGLDLAIRDTLGTHVELRVQERIIEQHHGELPGGSAEVIPTGDPRWPLLVCAPTMRVPENASRTNNAYLAFRAALLAVRAYAATENTVVRSMVCPGLCTGVGAMPARRCAAQMRIAWRQVTSSPKTPSFADIHKTHHALQSE